MTEHTLFAASILAADFARLGAEADAVLQAGCDWIHFDVMDNHFVPNLTIGPGVCEALRRDGIKAPIDAHLMVDPLGCLPARFAEAGADWITIHYEVCQDVTTTLAQIKNLGVKVGLAINPQTSVSVLQPYLAHVDLILVMSVEPGFGGQAFMPGALGKLQTLRHWVDAQCLNVILQVDGGINRDTIRSVVDAGADVCVMGSAIYQTKNYTQTVSELRKIIV